MKITMINGDDVTTYSWSGGISKQYYIFPADSTYAKADFAFRLSMAVSYSNEKAQYSHLENITRHLVMLEGTAHVFHKGYYDIVMNPYTEIDVFDGGWDSSGIGQVTDFNMMLNRGTHGKMSVINDNMVNVIGGSCESCQRNYNRTAFFCGCGLASFVFSTGEAVSISRNDLLLLEDFPADLFASISLSASKLIRMDVCCY